MKVDIFSEKTAKILSLVGLLLIALGAAVFIIFRSWDFSWTINEEKVGQFGDFVGGVVGSIFAFVGVILYYVALTEQRKDIDINRKALETQVETLNQQIKEFKAQTTEMQETRTVYEEQTNLYREQTNYYQQQVKELKKQTNIASLQQFNSEFYSLLGVFINFKKDCKEPIKRVLESLRKKVQSNKGTVCDKHSCLIKEYTNQYYQESVSLSVYFQTLYRLLKMIEDSNIEPTHKQRYAKTLRSQLSENELLLIYYDYCSDLGEKVRLLALKYDLLKHLNMMDRIEIDASRFESDKVLVLSMFNKLSVLFDLKIQQSKDLETEDDIVVDEEFPFINTTSSYNLVITEESFSFGIKIPKQQNIYNKEDIRNLFLLFLYEYFFLSKLKFPVDKVFEKQLIEEDNTFEFKYKLELEKIM